MIQSSNFKPCIPFGHSTNNMGIVPRSKIQGVIVERFLRSLYPNDQEREALPDQKIREIKSRVTSKSRASKLFGKRYYQVAATDHVPDDLEIFNWFLCGKHGKKLHRRSVTSSDIQVEAFLREAGVDINFQDEKSGDTPLILASRAHNATLVKTLIDSGAKIDLVNRHGRDAIHEAVDAISTNKTPYRNDSLFSTVECLIRHEANVNQPLTTCSCFQISLANYAIPRTELRTANLFISSLEDFNGSVLLELVLEKQADNPDIIRSLASVNGFDPNIRSARGNTPLILACMYYRPECLKALLEHPQIDLEATVVRPVQTFDKNWSAYSFAALNGFNDCAELLAEKGAKKIVPSLTEGEQRWLDRLEAAKSNRDLAFFAAPIALFNPFSAILGGLFAGALVSNVQNIEANRPQPQLDTPPLEE